MDFKFDILILVTGIAIFLARIVDVSLGTLRTISIVQARTWMAFWLGFFEVAIWLCVISSVIYKIKEIPLLGVFYAFGFATGNIVGIRIEKWLSLGHLIVRVISREHYKDMADTIRRAGYAVTTFRGEGKSGPVVELYIVCRRKNLREILRMVHSLAPNAFYVTEPAGTICNSYHPTLQPVTGWRAILKKK
jgi:uncharacterized protein YebE (UPF0316 family)